MIVVVADQLAWGDVSIHGNAVLETPNLDRLAREGVRGDRYLTNEGGAKSLGTLLVGQYSTRWTRLSGSGDSLENWLHPSLVTLGEIFQANDYVTGYFGRWPFGSSFPYLPSDQGFEVFAGFFGQGLINRENTVGLQRQTGDSIGSGLNDRIGSSVVEFIGRQRTEKEGRPYVCVVCPSAFWSEEQIPASLREKVGKELGESAPSICRVASAHECDQLVGRITAALAAHGELDDTLILFTSDGGLHPGQHQAAEAGSRRGQEIDEDGTRVPFFVRWPRWISPGRTIVPPIADIDVLPSLKVFCSLMEGSEDGSFEGKSVAALAYGLPMRWKDRYLFQRFGITGERRAVRSLEWRATSMEDDVNRWGLYHMFVDPEQATDVASDHPDTIEKMAEAYQVWWDTLRSSEDGGNCIEIGHSEAPVVDLRACDAAIVGGEGREAKRRGGTWAADDWIDAWELGGGQLTWAVRVVRAGVYTLVADCGGTKLGGTLKVSLSGGLCNEPIDLGVGLLGKDGGQAAGEEVRDLESVGRTEQPSIDIHLAEGTGILTLERGSGGGDYVFRGIQLRADGR